jgi:hypothetical protein
VTAVGPDATVPVAVFSCAAEEAEPVAPRQRMRLNPPMISREPPRSRIFARLRILVSRSGADG